ncbi:MAG: hypothetical protein PHO02_05120 [Candidatus Nanoarchaeia archaeon]|nr:hypothetical protein [Candidatus Nanoarchaeia archaeon]
MKKALGLTALVGMFGCADFHTQMPVSWYILESGKSVQIEDNGRHVTIKYSAPSSGDWEKDDIVHLECYEPFSLAKKLEFTIGGSGKFYGCGALFNYTVVNDNDGDAANNILGFSARRW